ncbi:MAG: PIN domain-containing protein [Candidatus Bathyarchaeia archaeon]
MNLEERGRGRKRELSGSLVLDTGALLELIYSTEKGLKLKDALKSEKVQANISELTLTELMYILCRKIGEKEAQDRVGYLLDSGYVILHEDSKLVELAAEYKCRRGISLADCLALAKKISSPAIFARREDELLEEMSREPFDVKILFLEDF